MVASVVISRVLRGDSKLYAAASTRLSALPGAAGGPCSWWRRISHLASGPPTSPPITRPKVAQAMPRVMAPCTPCSRSSTLPQAPAVPWPPSKVMEPAISPTSGSSPSRVARLTPTAFCTPMNTAITTRKMSSARPPSLSLEKLALRPMEEKNTSMKAVCSSPSKLRR